MKRLILSALLSTPLMAAAETAPEYTITTIPDTPSKFDTRQIDGMDFLPDGRLAVCQPSGEVFFYTPATQKWELFAEGLHNPLGLIAISNSELIISQRPEVTRVRDTDGDGKADDYEVISDDFGISGNYHEFHFTPVQAKDGSIYFALGCASSGDGIRSIVRGKFDPRGRPGRMHASVPYRGCVMKITPEGKTIPWSYGHRTPNGLGMDLDGNLFVTDNQGDWVGSSKLFHVQEGRFYGHAISLTWKPDFEGDPLSTPVAALDKLRTRACVVFPHGSMANSPTEVLAIPPEANIGPFTGQLLVGEMNKGRIMRVMLEEVDGELQGACIPFIDGRGLRTGCNRMAWAPDGSLYTGHTKHTWAGNEGIQHVQWNGEIPFEVQNMNLTKTGFRFTFTEPVDRAIASKPETWPFKRYYYEYHRSYGSKQYDVVPVPVKTVTVSKDGKTVDVELTELAAWHIHEVSIAGLNAADGTALNNPYIAYTLNRLLENTPPEPIQYQVEGKAKAPGPKVTPQKAKNTRGKVLEAEDANLSGAAVRSGNNGFSGTGYIDFGKGKESIEWTFESKGNSQGELAIRYALAGGNRPLQLTVNGASQVIPFASSGSWTTWKDWPVKVPFKKGTNTVRLETLDASGGNIDHLQVID